MAEIFTDADHQAEAANYGGGHGGYNDTVELSEKGTIFLQNSADRLDFGQGYPGYAKAVSGKDFDSQGEREGEREREALQPVPVLT